MRVMLNLLLFHSNLECFFTKMDTCPSVQETPLWDALADMRENMYEPRCQSSP